MGQAAGCHILAIMGSGETSPTMVTVHRALVSRLGMGSPRALLLETPYAFQENAADVSSRARGYFARSVGLAVTAVAGEAIPAAGLQLQDTADGTPVAGTPARRTGHI